MTQNLGDEKVLAIPELFACYETKPNALACARNEKVACSSQVTSSRKTPGFLVKPGVFCPKSKRALLISPSHLAEPVQKAYQRVFASMELLKIVLTFYPRESNNYPAYSQCLPAKSTLDATYFKLHLKC